MGKMMMKRYDKNWGLFLIHHYGCQNIAPHILKLHDLKTRFKLQKSEAADFFLEWRDQSVVLTESERGVLDRLKRNYLYLLEYPVMESIVKIVVLSPILDLAGFYEPPIQVEGGSEYSSECGR